MWPAIRPQTKLFSRVPGRPGRCIPGPRTNERRTAGDLHLRFHLPFNSPICLMDYRSRILKRPFERDSPPGSSLASKQPLQGTNHDACILHFRHLHGERVDRQRVRFRCHVQHLTFGHRYHRGRRGVYLGSIAWHGMAWRRMRFHGLGNRVGRDTGTGQGGRG